MSLRPIVRWPDPVLSQPCAPVRDQDVRALAADMLETMYDAPGRGLAAPQVGVLLRLFVMDATWKDGAPSPVVCINPQIVEVGADFGLGDEGCLSIPGISAAVERPLSVRMVWDDLDDARHDQWLDGFAARCAQHELDHLDGIVTFDRVDAATRASLLSQYEAA